MDITITKLSINPEEASKLTGIGINEMRRMCYLPDFPAFKVGRKILIDYEGLKKWIARQAGIRSGFQQRNKIWN